MPSGTTRKMKDDEVRLLTNFVDLLDKMLSLEPSKRPLPKVSVSFSKAPYSLVTMTHSFSSFDAGSTRASFHSRLSATRFIFQDLVFITLAFVVHHPVDLTILSYTSSLHCASVLRLAGNGESRLSEENIQKHFSQRASRESSRRAFALVQCYTERVSQLSQSCGCTREMSQFYRND
jgi:hypothetical protein